MDSKSHLYSCLIRWDPRDNVFIATCAEFPGLSTFGENRTEALAEFDLVLCGFIESYEEDGVPLPEPKTVIE